MIKIKKELYDWIISEGDNWYLDYGKHDSNRIGLYLIGGTKTAKGSIILKKSLRISTESCCEFMPSIVEGAMALGISTLAKNNLTCYGILRIGGLYSKLFKEVRGEDVAKLSEENPEMVFLHYVTRDCLADSALDCEEYDFVTDKPMVIMDKYFAGDYNEIYDYWEDCALLEYEIIK